MSNVLILLVKDEYLMMPIALGSKPDPNASTGMVAPVLRRESDARFGPSATTTSFPHPTHPRTLANGRETQQVQHLDQLSTPINPTDAISIYPAGHHGRIESIPTTHPPPLLRSPAAITLPLLGDPTA